MTSLHPLTKLLQSALDDEVFPGAVLQVQLRGAVMHCEAVGRLTYDHHSPLVTPETIFDLASLTKPLATTTAVLHLIEARRVDLAQPIADVLGELRSAPIGAATIEQLLSHTAGLPAWRPFYQQLAQQPGAVDLRVDRGRAVRQVLEWIAAEPLEAPLGTTCLYSDLGFMLLGFAVEHVVQTTLSAWWRQHAASLVGQRALDFIELPCDSATGFGRTAAIAPTEQDMWRGRMVCGEVHDENAWALGGVAGHAGLFGTADAVAQMGQWWLRGAVGLDSEVGTPLFRRFTTRVGGSPEKSRALGWDTPSRPSSSGQYWSASSFGHLGFTGTSLWVDPTRELVVAFVSNRVCPTRANEKIKRFRPRLHDAVWEVWGRRV